MQWCSVGCIMACGGQRPHAGGGRTHSHREEGEAGELSVVGQGGGAPHHGAAKWAASERRWAQHAVCRVEATRKLRIQSARGSNSDRTRSELQASPDPGRAPARARSGRSRVSLTRNATFRRKVVSCLRSLTRPWPGSGPGLEWQKSCCTSSERGVAALRRRLELQRVEPLMHSHPVN